MGHDFFLGRYLYKCLLSHCRKTWLLIGVIPLHQCGSDAIGQHLYHLTVSPLEPVQLDLQSFGPWPVCTRFFPVVGRREKRWRSTGRNTLKTLRCALWMVRISFLQRSNQVLQSVLDVVRWNMDSWLIGALQSGAFCKNGRWHQDPGEGVSVSGYVWDANLEPAPCVRLSQWNWMMWVNCQLSRQWQLRLVGRRQDDCTRVCLHHRAMNDQVN